MDRDVHYDFYLDFIKRSFQTLDIVGLDYGCGKGRFIKYARKYDCFFEGVENFYGQVERNTTTTEIDSIKIHLIHADGKIPFPDNYFDFVASMQVFEHVENLDLVLSEINRVLKPNGIILCDFPLKYSINEPHYHIPVSHWFDKNSETRKFWCRIFYSIGFGAKREKGMPFNEWYSEASSYMDSFCHYRSEATFRQICKKNFFTVIPQDYQRLMYKLGGSVNQSSTMGKLVSLFPQAIVSKALRIRASSIFKLQKVG